MLFVDYRHNASVRCGFYDYLGKSRRNCNRLTLSQLITAQVLWAAVLHSQSQSCVLFYNAKFQCILNSLSVSTLTQSRRKAEGNRVVKVQAWQNARSDAQQWTQQQAAFSADFYTHRILCWKLTELLIVSHVKFVRSLRIHRIVWRFSSNLRSRCTQWHSRSVSWICAITITQCCQMSSSVKLKLS